MKRSMMILALFSFLFAACSEDNPSFSLLADKDVFYQAKNLTNTKVDILWVIDNSGSMQSSQNQLISQFGTFIAAFATRNYDFQMAVTTTDAYRSAITLNPLDSKFKDGLDLTSHTGYFIVNPETPDYQNVFLVNIMQGIIGNGDERAFSSFREALNNTMNVGLVRPDSFLAVIIVSDEDDFSHAGSFFTNDYNSPSLDSIATYTDFLDQITNSSATYKRYSVSAMAIWDDACKDQLNSTFLGRKVGIRYGQLVDATAGQKGSLCGNFADDLQVISEGIIQLATQFYLSRIPVPETIKVIINNKVIPQVADTAHPQDGWMYDVANNSVKIYGSAIPAQGSQLDITFDPVAIGQ